MRAVAAGAAGVTHGLGRGTPSGAGRRTPAAAPAGSDTKHASLATAPAAGAAGAAAAARSAGQCGSGQVVNTYVTKLSY